MKRGSKLHTWMAEVKAGKRPARDLGAELLCVSGEIRPKRPSGTLSGQWAKVAFQVPMAIKSEWVAVARQLNITQAELGLAIVRAALRDQAFLKAAIAAGRS